MRFIALFCLVLMTQCNDNNDPIFCTEEYVFGLSVTVKDANTNDILIEDITIVAQDGEYEEELMNIQGTNDFIGAGERSGNYIIKVTANNYQDFTSDVILVEADECHVIPETLQVLLQPN